MLFCNKYMPHVVEQSQTRAVLKQINLFRTNFYMTAEISCTWLISLSSRKLWSIYEFMWLCALENHRLLFHSPMSNPLVAVCHMLDLVTEEEPYLQCLLSQCLEHSDPRVDPSLWGDNTHLESVITWKQRLWGGESGVLHSDRAWSFLGMKVVFAHSSWLGTRSPFRSLLIQILLQFYEKK